MKCYYHPEKDAVSTCRCGKTACRDCIGYVGGAMLCKDCMALAWQILLAEKEAASKKAKRSIMWSWVATATVSFFVIPMIFQQADTPAIGKMGSSLFAVYAIWSTYWGRKVVWPWWRELWSRIGCVLIANPITWIIVIACFSTFLL
jgi:hypothetical protein